MQSMVSRKLPDWRKRCSVSAFISGSSKIPMFSNLKGHAVQVDGKNVYGLIGVPIFQDTGLISSQLFIQHVKLIGINLRLKLRIIPGGYEKFIAFIALYKLRRKQVSILMQEGIAQVPSVL